MSAGDQAPKANPMTKQRVIELIRHWSEDACNCDDNELRQVIEWIERWDQSQLTAVRELRGLSNLP
jgi:hypothetical protein